MRISTAALVAAALAVAAPAARAQMAGYYIGTLPDGNGITITVTDEGDGSLAVTALSYGLSTKCKGGSTFDTGWGLGFSAPIVSGEATEDFIDPYIDTKLSLEFSGDGAAGKIASYTPELYQPHDIPKKALLCSEATQSFTATYSATAPAAPAPQRGTATLYLPAQR